MRGELEPDFIFFDSRTGLAEIAAVCTVELAEAIVALTGLNPQGVDGLADVVTRIRRHPVRQRPPLFFLAYSPVPRLEDLEIEGAWTRLDPLEPGSFRPEVLGHPFATRIAQAHDKLWMSAMAGNEEEEHELRKWFPAVPKYERLHLLEYDPVVPLIGEDDFDRPGRLHDALRQLARSVGLTSGRDLLPDARPRSKGGEQGTWLERVGSLHRAIDERR